MTSRRQYGVISLDQLLQAGISDDQVARWVRQKRLHRLHREMNAPGHTCLMRGYRPRPARGPDLEQAFDS